MSCQIIFIRHGETLWNQDARLQGQVDIPLSEKGINQANALKIRLAQWKLDAFFSSDLSRARDTAAIIARAHNKPVNVIPDLREINFGLWEGLTIAEIQQKYSREIKDWWANPETTRVPGGENLAELAERSTGATKKLIEDYPDHRVAVVAHGGTIRSVVARALGLDLNSYWRLRQDNASITIIDYHGWGKGILVLYNDCSHLSTGFPLE